MFLIIIILDSRMTTTSVLCYVYLSLSAFVFDTII